MEDILVDNYDSGEAWQTLFYALLASDETNDWYEIDEHLSVRMYQWDHAELYDSEHDKFFNSHYVMCCEDEEEFTAEATGQLLEKYVKLIESIPKPVQCVEQAHCWEQVKPFYELVESSSRIIRYVFENCYWGLYYGDYGFETLMENDWNYGLPRELALELWRIAYWWCAEGCMVEEAA